MPAYPPGVRLLPNAITVLALCSGMSGGVLRPRRAVRARRGRGRRRPALLRRASTAGSPGCSTPPADRRRAGLAGRPASRSAWRPALVLYIWRLEGTSAGWIVALVFAVCMALRLARFNTLIDDTEQPPFAKEFFVGVPAPAAALLAGLPIVPVSCSSAPAGGRARSRSARSGRGRRADGQPAADAVAQDACGCRRDWPRRCWCCVALVAAVLITFPFLALAVVAIGYLALMPYSRAPLPLAGPAPGGLGRAGRQRRAVVRAARSAQRLGLRRPLRRRVADPFRSGAASLRSRRRRGSLDADPAAAPPLHRFRGRRPARTGRSRRARRSAAGRRCPASRRATATSHARPAAARAARRPPPPLTAPPQALRRRPLPTCRGF